MVLTPDFFQRDVLEIAPDLPGKLLMRKFKNGEQKAYRITEVEAYRGEEDLACHASKGKTPRTSVMYEPGGVWYVYLIYGIHWMLNVVTAEQGNPQAVLIRGIESWNGPGKLTKALGITKVFNGKKLSEGTGLWIAADEQSYEKQEVLQASRIGIDYAGDYWKNKLWRYYLSV